jgi:tetratricopeptide (TPR) repeat protein
MAVNPAQGADAARECFLAGLDRFRAGDFAGAEGNFLAALALSPDRPSVLTNLANALLEQREFGEARIYAMRATEVDPSSYEAWFTLGRCSAGEGNHELALACMDNALARRPAAVPALFHRGAALNHLQRHEAAFESYSHAVAIDPGHANAWLNAGVSLAYLRRYREAADTFAGALRAQPDFPQAHLNLGITYFKTQRYEAALAQFDRGLALAPQDPELWFNRGIVFAEWNRHDEALRCYDAALRTRPDYAEAWCNRGVALKACFRDAEALENYDRALAHKADFVEAWSNRGVVLFESRRYAAALESYAKALHLRPGHPDANWNESHVRLLLGQFAVGWNKYGARWQRHRADAPRHVQRPLLSLDQASAPRRILLWAEQGYGDTLQFCRYAPLLARTGAQVIVEVPEPLRELMGSLESCTVIAQSATPPDFDFQAPLMDLPRIFETTLDTVPAPAAYLRADLGAIARWTERLGPRGRKLRIAVATAGNPQNANDHRRSMPLRELAPLLDLAQVLVVQKELSTDDAHYWRGHPEMQFLGPQIASFADSAAIASLVDVVISVDTSLAHLAGALGRPVWILLPWAPEWRWLLDRSDSPWYPSARLFRQESAGDWSGVVAQVATALRQRTTADGDKR